MLSDWNWIQNPNLSFLFPIVKYILKSIHLEYWLMYRWWHCQCPHVSCRVIINLPGDQILTWQRVTLPTTIIIIIIIITLPWAGQFSLILVLNANKLMQHPLPVFLRMNWIYIQINIISKHLIRTQKQFVSQALSPADNTEQKYFKLFYVELLKYQDHQRQWHQFPLLFSDEGRFKMRSFIFGQDLNFNPWLRRLVPGCVSDWRDEWII